jgi:hypothetical protein
MLSFQLALQISSLSRGTEPLPRTKKQPCLAVWLQPSDQLFHTSAGALTLTISEKQIPDIGKIYEP